MIAEIDLLDSELHADPVRSEAVWTRLRDQEPLHWQPGRDGSPGFFALTRHADAQRIYEDRTTFVSSHGNMLGTLLRGGDSAGGRMLVVTDGERHSALRRLLMPGFGKAALETVASVVEFAAAELVGGALATGSCDFASDIAARIPLLAICELLAVPIAERERVLEMTNAAMEVGEDGLPNLGAKVAQSEILQYYASIASTRREGMGSDVVSLLARARIGGRELSVDEVVLNCYNLVIGGDETARLALAGAVLAFAEHHEEWERLRSRPDLLGSAVEEILRWTTPARHVARIATADTVLHDEVIRSGDIVTIWNAAANGDPRVFDKPGRFAVDRSPNKHLTFGWGPHFCIGAQLTRLELRTVVEALRTRVASFELNGCVTRIRSNFLGGISQLPVSFHQA